MKERPILFSTRMVRAILEGRKTQTRRVLQPEAFCPDPRPYRKSFKVGDMLWVRETWAYGCAEDAAVKVVVFKADMNPEDAKDAGRLRSPGLTRAYQFNRWRPCIFMPRMASRITLEITATKIDRIQDISHEDAMAEGCQGHDWVASSPYVAGPHTDAGQLPEEEFRELWDSINFRRGFGWKQNPWVWVIEFRRL